MRTRNVEVHFKGTLLEKLNHLELKWTDIHAEIPATSVMQQVSVYEKDNSCNYVLSAVDKLSLDTYLDWSHGQTTLQMMAGESHCRLALGAEKGVQFSVSTILILTSLFDMPTPGLASVNS